MMRVKKNSLEMNAIIGFLIKLSFNYLTNNISLVKQRQFSMEILYLILQPLKEQNLLTNVRKDFQ